VKLPNYLILLLFLTIFPALAAAPSATTAKEELQQLRARIEALQNQITSAEASRNEAADALRESERAISAANRELTELDQSSRELSKRAEDLRAESRKATDALEGHQKNLARLLHDQHVRHGGHQPETLNLLLNGENPNDLARDLHYLGYVSRARGDAVRGMRDSLAKLKSLSDEAAAKAAALAAVGAQQLNQRNRLEGEKRKRAEVVTRLSRDIQNQRREVGAMQRNETRLTTLIEQLARVIARPAPAPRDKAAAPRPQNEPKERIERSERKARNESAPEPTIANAITQAFSQLRGRLALPVQGELAGRFGSPRSDGGLTWKGLFVAAKPGESVRAVAGGRVVYADWLRGFGNLLIVDHGEGYMSLYGYNESLLKRVGDEIHGGDPVATVGNSGGSADSGLYFELRHQGKPFDPLGWVGRR
jgi:septal ring factor EnvC (AmiA/AmiB activator)